MKKVTLEARTYDEALTNAAKELGITKDYVRLEEVSRKSFPVKMITFDAYVDINPKEMGYNMLRTMFRNMGIEASIEMTTGESGQIKYSVQTDENPVLIGKNGKTLEAIEYYIRVAVNNYTEEYQMIIVDIGNYKRNRQKQLEIIATKTAKEVAKTKIEAVLEPMNAYERRIVHAKLSDWRDVVTESIGEGTGRRLVIKPTK